MLPAGEYSLLENEKGVPMKHKMKSFLKNFAKCGLTGWCMEIIFTALHSLRGTDKTLKGVTSLWMFPIYGCAALIGPLSRMLKNLSVWKRGFTYMSLIFSGEYLAGSLLSRHHACPWDYGESRFNIDRLIRLDYAPYWFGAGLFFEKLLS
jgi:uncharacterized membrane protein